MTNSEFYKALWLQKCNEHSFSLENPGNFPGAWRMQAVRSGKSLSAFSLDAFKHETWRKYTSEWENKTADEAVKLRVIDKIGFTNEELNDDQIRQLFAREITQLMQSDEVQAAIGEAVGKVTFDSEHHQKMNSLRIWLKQ